MGEFDIHADNLKLMRRAIGVTSQGMTESLSPNDLNVVLRCLSIVSLVSINGIVRILKCRESTNVEARHTSSFLPLTVCSISDDDFVSIFRVHKPRLLAHFCEDLIKTKIYMNAITDKHKALRTAVASNTVSAEALAAAAERKFSFAWTPAGAAFSRLQNFCSELGTVMLTISCAEGDFSLMNWRRNDHCADLAN